MLDNGLKESFYLGNGCIQMGLSLRGNSRTISPKGQDIGTLAMETW